MEKLLLRPREAQEAMGIGRSKMYQLLNTPGFPIVRLGERSLRVPRAGLEKWLDEHGNGSQGES